MNKNKILFTILGVILFIGVVYLVMNLNSSTKTPTRAPTGDFSVWIYGDSPADFQAFLDEFKASNSTYQNKAITVESFDDYEIYQNTLTSAFLQGAGPDMFILNNNETSVLENQILGIDPNFISPNDFRKAYKGVFGDDLISKLEDDATVEFLKGVPMGYEALGVFFNRRNFQSSDFATWTSLGSSIGDIIEKDAGITPLGMGNGNVVFVSDILMQLFLSLGADSLVDTSSNIIKQAFQTYTSYGDSRGENAYNRLSLTSSVETNLDYFSRGDVAAVIGYPRTLLEIEKKGYQKNFLLATPFPQYATGEKKTLINYNYFVVSKDSANTQLANDILAYMVSQEGIDAYMELFPYYLPATLSGEADILEKKINPNFNIVYKDFISRETTLSSYNSGDRVIFESSIIPVVSSEGNSDVLFEKVKSKVICASNKALTLANLSSSCN